MLSHLSLFSNPTMATSSFSNELCLPTEDSLKGDGPASEFLLMKICMVHLAGSMVNLHSRRIKFTGKICVISILLLRKFYSIVDYMSLNYLVQ